MINNIKSGYDISLASCYAKEGGIEGTTLDRKILSLGANTLLKIFFPIKGVKTFSSFYRAYNAGMLKKAFKAYDNKLIEMPGFVCMVEMLIKLWRLKIKIIEVPMILKFNMRQDKSKIKIGKNIRGYLKLIKNEFFLKDKKKYRQAMQKYLNL